MGAWVDMAPSAPRLPSYAFYQPVLSEETASKVNKFEGLPMPNYTLEISVNIFQMLETEAHQAPMLLLEGIKRATSKGVKAEKRVVLLIELSPD